MSTDKNGVAAIGVDDGEQLLGPAANIPYDATDAGPESAPIYRAGTLRYNRRQLALVFCWLLGGDFAFAFFEQVFTKFIPLYAKDLQGSNLLIGLMSGSFAGLINFLFLPHVSMRSDRHRGRFGRRIPLLLWATPCTVGSLLLVGFAPEIGKALHGWLPASVPVSSTSLILGLLCVFVVLYHLWNMVLVNGYNWLIRDVVPLPVIGRFLSSFRVVTTLASFAFLKWVFPLLGKHRIEVFVIVGVVYTAVFLLMCWGVQEGKYPPPTQVEPGMLVSLKRYFRQCLSIRLYRQYFFFHFLMVIAGSSAGPFLTLYSRETLHLSMEEIGQILSWGTLASALIYFPLGWLCDRFQPARVVIVGVVLHALVAGLAFFLVHDKNSWWVYAVVGTIPTGTYLLGSSALSMRLFPSAEYGQFAAGLNVFGFGGIFIGNYVLGTFMDLVHSNYQLVFLWSAVLNAAAVFPMLAVFRGWKQHGGPDRYVAPLPEGLRPATA